MSVNASMGIISRPDGPPVYVIFPVYLQCTRRCRMPANDREPFRASMYTGMPELRVPCPIAERANDKERRRTEKWCPGAGTRFGNRTRDLTQGAGGFRPIAVSEEFSGSPAPRSSFELHADQHSHGRLTERQSLGRRFCYPKTLQDILCNGTCYTAQYRRGERTGNRRYRSGN